MPTHFFNFAYSAGPLKPRGPIGHGLVGLCLNPALWGGGSPHYDVMDKNKLKDRLDDVSVGIEYCFSFPSLCLWIKIFGHHLSHFYNDLCGAITPIRIAASKSPSTLP